MTSRTSLPFPIEWGNENQLRRSFEKSKSTPTSIRHFTRRRSKSDEEDDSDVLLGDVIQTRNPLSWNITTNVSPSPASTISQSPSSTPALTYTTASEEHAQLQEHFRDETFRLKLDLKSTNHELKMVTAEALGHQQTITSMCNEISKSDTDIMDLCQQLEVSETKLLQVKKINLCLRLKHEDYERQLQRMNTNYKLQLEMEKNTRRGLQQQCDAHQQELKQRDEQMQSLNDELQSVRDMVNVLMERQSVSNTKLVTSFATGIVIGIVSLLLPRRFQ